MPKTAKNTGRAGSRTSQKKTIQAKLGHKPSTKKKNPKETRGRPRGKDKMTVKDFDLAVHRNGPQVDYVEGREARLPMVIQGMRECKSARVLGAELGVSHVTIASDKKWVLEEAWELRQGLMSVWLEEQLQQYDYLLEKLHKQLMVTLEYQSPAEDGTIVFTLKLGEDGEPIRIVNLEILDQIVRIMDKVNAIKGLTSSNINIFALSKGAELNDPNSNRQDSESADELLDFLKSGKMGTGKAPLVS